MQTFTRNERLRERKIIEALFEKGKSIRQGPVMLIWHTLDFENFRMPGVLISASRKKLRRAVDRNRMKRRMREAYRKNNEGLKEYLKQKQTTCVFAFIYNSAELAIYTTVEEKIIQLMQRFQTEYEKSVR